MTDARHALKPEELEALEAPPVFMSDLVCEYRNHMGDDDEIIEAMLVSTLGAEDGIDPETSEYQQSRKPRLNFMAKHRHGSPFEQAALKFYVKAPIMVFREWHRHRIGFSYNEVSARYKVMKPHFYIPGRERPIIQIGKHSAAEWVPDEGGFIHDEMREAMEDTYEQEWATYVQLIKAGVAKEVARAVLGVGLYSEMIVTLNPRSCMAFLSLRQHHPDAMFVSRPQWEINQCADQMEAVFAELFPLTHEVYVANGRVAP